MSTVRADGDLVRVLIDRGRGRWAAFELEIDFNGIYLAGLDIVARKSPEKQALLMSL